MAARTINETATIPAKLAVNNGAKATARHGTNGIRASTRRTKKGS